MRLQSKSDQNFWCLLGHISQSIRGRVEALFKSMTDVITLLCGEQTGVGVWKARGEQK